MRVCDRQFGQFRSLSFVEIWRGALKEAKMQDLECHSLGCKSSIVKRL